MGYYAQFPMPIPHLGARWIVLLTLSPLALAGPFDLHALTTPPAFNLSQDQTLHLIAVDRALRHALGKMKRPTCFAGVALRRSGGSDAAAACATTPSRQPG